MRAEDNKCVSIISNYDQAATKIHERIESLLKYESNTTTRLRGLK